jgi:hypothetical protein
MRGIARSRLAPIRRRGSRHRACRCRSDWLPRKSAEASRPTSELHRYSRYWRDTIAWYFAWLYDRSALPAEPEALLQRHEILDQFRLSRHAILLRGEASALCIEPVERRGGPRSIAHLRQEG